MSNHPHIPLRAILLQLFTICLPLFFSTPAWAAPAGSGPVPGPEQAPEAAHTWGNGKLYFFDCEAGYLDRYFRYDIAADKVDYGPQDTKTNWPGWPAHWGYDIDAALNLDDGRVIFFRQDQFILYNIQTDSVETGYPKPVYDLLGWPSTFDKVNAAINWGNGKGYIFSGSKYLRFNLATLTVDDGYPAFITAGWPGYPAWSEVDAISDMNNGLYLFLGQGHGSYFNKNTNQFLGDFIFTGLSGNWPANFKTPKGGMRIGSQLYYFQYEPDAENAQYLRFDTNTQAIDAGFPRKVSQDWAAGTWPAPWNCVDAAVNWGNGKAYFFSGARYLRYDIRQDRVDPGYPLPIQGNWPGWPSTWTQVRAAVNWGNGKVYFFFGPDYLRYDIRSDRVDPGFPANTQANWPGLSAPWVPDSAVNWGSGKAYFFLGDHYYRYDVAADHFDTGYPKPILGNWAGWPVDGLGQLMPYRAGVLWGVPLGPGRVYLPLVKK